MPVSLKTAAQAWNTETILSWDPDTDSFDTEILGRKRNIDPFVSLWHRSSRRSALFVAPDTDLSKLYVAKHAPTGIVYLVSQTYEKDHYKGEGIYSVMLRIQKAMSPSGGRGEFYPVTVSGTGDNLGAVAVGPAVPAYLDVELRAIERPDASIYEDVGEYIVFCSHNFSPKDGDFIKLGAEWYHSKEWYCEAGFLCARAIRSEPAFITATFELIDADSPVIDPSLGKMTLNTPKLREVSTQIEEQALSGRANERLYSSKVTCYVVFGHIGFTPRLGQKVTVSGVRYTIVNVTAQKDAGQWKLELSQ